jgi:hypothetical protein
MREDIRILCGRVWRQKDYKGLTLAIRKDAAEAVRNGYSRRTKRTWASELAKLIGVIPNTIDRYIHGGYTPFEGQTNAYYQKLPDLPTSLGILKVLELEKFQKIEKLVEPQRKPRTKTASLSSPKETEINLMSSVLHRLEDLEEQIRGMKRAMGR